jgi:hypothetical protein
MKHRKVTVSEESRVTRRQEVVDIIKRDVVATAEEIGSEMRTLKDRIHNIVSYNNKMHNKNPKKYPHITNTGVGYTLRPKVEHSMYDAGSRMKHAHSLVANGAPSLAHCREVNPKFFTYLSGQYNLSSAGILKMITKHGYTKKYSGK